MAAKEHFLVAENIMEIFSQLARTAGGRYASS